jgi:hypothetical protein
MAAGVARVLIQRAATARGKDRVAFSVDVWESEKGWHWKLPNDTKASAPYRTRAAAVEAARERDGLRPDA